MEMIMKLPTIKPVNIDVKLAKKGNKEAYVRLIRENKETMYRVAKSILVKEEDVEDAVSETILKAYISIENLRRNEYFKTWLIKILINESNTILRKRTKEIVVEEIYSEKLAKEDKYKELDLYDAINKLEKDLRITTLLFYFEDMKYSEIAKILNIKEGTVKSRLSRAKEKLYNQLKGVK